MFICFYVCQLVSRNQGKINLFCINTTLTLIILITNLLKLLCFNAVSPSVSITLSPTFSFFRHYHSPSLLLSLTLPIFPPHYQTISLPLPQSYLIYCTHRSNVTTLYSVMLYFALEIALYSAEFGQHYIILY